MTNNTIGVWLHDDGTLGAPDPSNPYRYCANDPTNATDPS
jgi:RHS repeat-associated protein